MRLLALLLVGCGVQEIGGGTGLDLPFLSLVYQCVDDAGVTVELCYDGDPGDIEEALAVTCAPTQRHLGPCWYSCDEGHSGCNAKQSCFCPSD
jgi:hypothetical protein